MDKNLSCRLPMIASQQKIAKLLCFSNLAISFVNPWGVEPQSKEPESFILSIELRVQYVSFFAFAAAKLQFFL